MDLIFDKEAKNTNSRKGSIFNKWCWLTVWLHAEELRDSYLLPYTKLRIKDLSTRPGTPNLREEEMNRFELKDLLSTTLIAQALRPT